jgi:hypothetical protein
MIRASPTMRWRRWRATVGLLAFVLAWSWAPRLTAENRMTLRGNYYREESTRVLAPSVAITVDAPDERFTIGAAYLLDAISSASIASGAANLGGDAVFTELRHEVTGTVGSKIGDWTMGGYFRYSTETDYVARRAGVSVARDVLERAGTLAFSYGFQFDRYSRVVSADQGTRPWCGGNVGVNDCTDKGYGENSNFLQIHQPGVAYTHAFHRTVLGQFGFEYAHQRGPQDNPYRRAGALNEAHPRRRNRFILSADVRWMIPKARLAFEPFYSFYADDWGVRAHTPELRVHIRIARHWRARVRYQYYRQTASFFWREDGQYAGDPGQCSRDNVGACATADVKVEPYDAHTPGAQLTWELDGIARNRGLHWLEGAWLQATYNHMFQNNRYGNARVGSLEFSLAF